VNHPTAPAGSGSNWRGLIAMRGKNVPDILC
jgi:hypothetical protein